MPPQRLIVGRTTKKPASLIVQWLLANSFSDVIFVSPSSHFPQLRPQADLTARFYNLLSRCEGGRCPKWGQ
jgi:hypothetical protein